MVFSSNSRYHQLWIHLSLNYYEVSENIFVALLPHHCQLHRTKKTLLSYRESLPRAGAPKFITFSSSFVFIPFFNKLKYKIPRIHLITQSSTTVPNDLIYTQIRTPKSFFKFF